MECKIVKDIESSYNHLSKYLLDKKVVDMLNSYDGIGINRKYNIYRDDGLVVVSDLKSYLAKGIIQTLKSIDLYKEYQNTVVFKQLDNEFIKFKEKILAVADNLYLEWLNDSIYNKPNEAIKKEFRENAEKIFNAKYTSKECKKSIGNLLKSIENFSMINGFENITSAVIDMRETFLHITKVVEFIKVKDTMVENLRYCCTDEQITNFINNHNAILNNNPIDVSKIEDFINQYNEVIKREYKKIITDVENFKSGDPYSFICHSTNSSDFSGGFRTPFVSTSFVDEELHDFFRGDVGFIMNPNDIVYAGDTDASVVNEADNVETLVRHSIMPIFLHPKLNMKLNKERKSTIQSENLDNDIVYNELVIDGFHPLAIFCLSDGSKSLNRSYEVALEIQKQFPNLKIVDIDLTMYKSKYMSDEIKKNNLKESLINKLNTMFGRPRITDIAILENYNLFFDKFNQMKKERNVTEEDIKKLYNDYTEKLLYGRVEKDEIFSEKYTEQEMYLYLNKKYDFSLMFEGYSIYKLNDIAKDFKDYDLSKIKNENIRDIIYVLKNISNNVDLKVLQEHFSKNNVTDINHFMKDTVMFLANKQNQLYDEIDNVNSEKNVVQKDLERVLSSNRKYENCQHIVDNNYYYRLAEKEVEDIEKLKPKKEQLEDEKSQVVLELNSIESSYNSKYLNYALMKDRHDNLQIEVDDLDSSYQDIQQQLDELYVQEQNQPYNKNKMLKFLHDNKDRILLSKVFHKKSSNSLDARKHELLTSSNDVITQKMLSEIELIKEEINISKFQDYSFEHQYKVYELKDKIAVINSNINNIDNKISSIANIKDRFSDKVGINFSNYKSELENAKKFINSYDYTSNMHEEKYLKERLNVLNNKLLAYQTNYGQLDDITSNRTL